MTTQIFVIIVILIFTNFVISITRTETQNKVKMTLIWQEWIDNGDARVERTKTIYDTEYEYDLKYENAMIILYGDSKILGIKKGRYGLIRGEFVERLN